MNEQSCSPQATARELERESLSERPQWRPLGAPPLHLPIESSKSGRVGSGQFGLGLGWVGLGREAAGKTSSSTALLPSELQAHPGTLVMPNILKFGGDPLEGFVGIKWMASWATSANSFDMMTPTQKHLWNLGVARV